MNVCVRMGVSIRMRAREMHAYACASACVSVLSKEREVNVFVRQFLYAHPCVAII